MRVLLAASLILFAVQVQAKTEIKSFGTGCPNNLCLWIVGTDLFRTTSDGSEGNKFNYSHINFYSAPSGAASERIARGFAREFKGLDQAGSEQRMHIRLDHPEVRKRMYEGGVYFRFVNPEADDSQASAQVHFLKWDGKTIIAEDFESLPVTAGTNFGIPRHFVNTERLNPAKNDVLGWIKDAFTLQARISEGPEKNKYIMGRTPVGRWGPTDFQSVGGGFTFSSSFCRTPPCANDARGESISKGYEEMFLTYRVNFANCPGSSVPFDFRKGGKLPGLGGGAGGPASGGGRNSSGPNGRNGWSARNTFGRGGAGGLYLYHPDMRNPTVIPVPPGGDTAIYHRHKETEKSIIYGHGFPYRNADGSQFVFTPNRWYTIEQRVKMNSVRGATGVGNFDGLIEVHVDGELKLRVENIRLRHGERYPAPDNQNISKRLDIDSLAFHHFHGGGTPESAPLNESCAAFDDVRVFHFE